VIRRGLLLALVALAALPAVASAHAVLQQSTPERGANLPAAPAQVTLRFNEAVEAKFGALKVFDASGKEVQQGEAFHPGGSGKAIGVRLERGLADGGYTATFRVISADSHPVAGGFVFSIGKGGAGAQSVDQLLQGSTSGPVTSTAFGAARAIQFTAIALGFGALLFFGLCWLPALRATAGAGAAWRAASEAFVARLRLLLALAAAAGLLSAAAGVILQGATGEGSSFWAAAKPDVVREVLSTKFGTVWGLGAVAWVLIGVLALVEGRRLPVLRPASVGATGLAVPAVRPGLVAMILPLGALCALPAIGGHAGVQEPRWLMLPANLLHVVAISAWLGGIAVLVLVLRAATQRLEAEDRRRLLVTVVGRFSAIAGPAFALILASGIAQSLASIDAVDQLWNTAYGRSVLIKFALFCGLVGLGFVNRNRVLPRLGRSVSAGVLLRRTLRIELATAIVVLGITGALATYPPSDSVAAGPFATHATLGDARLEVTVDPARTGLNGVHLYLFDRKTGAQWDKALEVTATAALPAKKIAAIPIDLRKAGPGHYTAEGASLGVAGKWTFAVTARVSDFDQFQTKFTVPIE
jgi:copper transport protein